MRTFQSSVGGVAAALFVEDVCCFSSRSLLEIVLPQANRSFDLRVQELCMRKRLSCSSSTCGRSGDQELSRAADPTRAGSADSHGAPWSERLYFES